LDKDDIIRELQDLVDALRQKVKVRVDPEEISVSKLLEILQEKEKTIEALNLQIIDHEKEMDKNTAIINNLRENLSK
jgi:biotin synthase-related radical SAM superfamily protein